LKIINSHFCKIDLFAHQRHCLRQSIIFCRAVSVIATVLAGRILGEDGFPLATISVSNFIAAFLLFTVYHAPPVGSPAMPIILRSFLLLAFLIINDHLFCSLADVAKEVSFLSETCWLSYLEGRIFRPFDIIERFRPNAIFF